MPAAGGCFTKMPIATGDVPYVRGIQATLTNAIQRAAAATGATYVNLTQHRRKRPRRLPASRRPLDRARAAGHQCRDRPSQCTRRVTDGGSDDEGARPALRGPRAVGSRAGARGHARVCAGGRDRRPIRRAAPGSSRHASERGIAEHGAAGATNPQIAQTLFVAFKTVEMHVGNVFRKLEITSCHQLRQKLTAQDH